MPLIKFLRSSTAGAIPVGLTYGEIAINVADRILYVGATDGNTVSIIGGSGGSGGSETTWSLTTPTTAVDIAGIPTGSTFGVGTTAVAILEQMLYPASPYGTMDGGTFG